MSVVNWPEGWHILTLPGPWRDHLLCGQCHDARRAAALVAGHRDSRDPPGPPGDPEAIPRWAEFRPGQPYPVCCPRHRDGNPRTRCDRQAPRRDCCNYHRAGGDPVAWCGNGTRGDLYNVEVTMPTIKELCDAALANAVTHGFAGRDVNIPIALALVHSEVSEALECYRDGEMEPATENNGKPIGFPSELADVVIRVFNLSAALDIDLEAAILAKMAYNATRPHRHGGKKI